MLAFCTTKGHKYKTCASFHDMWMGQKVHFIALNYCKKTNKTYDDDDDDDELIFSFYNHHDNSVNSST